ncbi:MULTISPECIES: flagellar hook capping FlgD N-terminal domain-containing protein [Oscillospiraceae]|uniref:flagellar hook capping FlgD N-terminal domain-containing protein n=1 Tax=Oscillospiraceae TaxID=216572 RepID=UPI000B38CBF3|nr:MULTISPECIES: flagellar hook capping FlgD N-terminal domain-containing protein [Oscillospiraceae]MBM6884880.1 flagellar hook capping protein [Pseudoflavonifractor phocaeensis]OUO41295.1 flagellar hook capping protein [Flavonifractor sp. An306]
MSSDFMQLGLESLSAGSAYAAQKSSSGSTVEELEKQGYTISNPDEDLGLDFTDFLQLMVAQLQNQTIDNATDTTDMLNQLVQMSVVSMMSSVKTSLDTLTVSTTMTYAASLVGKTVTVGAYNEDGELEEIVGEVTGTGTYQGTQVIFVNGEMYPLSSIMAVGELPEVPEEPGEGGDGGEGGGTGEGGEGETTPEV